ncbi:MAG: putative sugar O-methyltransferase [Candidatus Babeliales bacterium]|nr:putative sugar O-methyltransferase [Candidatus Babeliales bacterium]
MKINKILYTILFTQSIFCNTAKLNMNFCTASNNVYFDNLLNLIGSIHKTNFDSLNEISVFNLGLTQDQIEQLETIEKVKVYSVELTNPDLLKPFKTTTWGKHVPGWYAWKPVVIKQALDMFDNVLWIDAGNVVLKPLENLFLYIQQNGYFLTTIGNSEFKDKEYKISTKWQTTQYLINKFDLKNPTKNWILSQEPINASLMGASRKSINEFIMPLYDLSKDLKNYEDDGTTPEGFGTARHDQSLLTILGYLNGLKILRQDCTQNSPIYLNINKEEVPYYQTYHSDYVSDKTSIFCSRFDSRYNNAFSSFIKYKTKTKADLIVFSYDRPMQLYAFLESKEKYIKNVGEVHVIYRTSNNDYTQAYDVVKSQFSSVKFYKQGNNPHYDFKVLTLNCAFNSRNDYLMFAVDDIIITDYIDLEECVKALQSSNAYAFYLRLGFNINECYMMRVQSPAPKNIKLNDKIFSYKFSDGQGSWCYPNNVDMTIYRKDDIKADLLKIDMISPERLEFNWSNLADTNKTGLFFEHSKMVNIPLNLCYSNSVNRNMNLYSTTELLKKFNEGQRFDINKFYKIDNNAPHMEYKPEFTIKEKTFDDNWALMKTKYLEIKSKFSKEIELYPNQFWKDVTQRLSKLILGTPKLDFLNDYDISYTMVRSNFGPTQEFEEDYLSSYASQDTREKIKLFRENHDLLPKASKKLNCSINCLGQLFYAAKILENVNKEPKTIVELGGGYGNLAHIFKQILPDSTYIIFDLPETLAIQYIYLSQVLPNVKIYMHDEPLNNIDQNCVHLVPINLLKESNFKTDVFTSNFSFTDLHENTRKLVLDKKFFNSDLVYISGEIHTDNKAIVSDLRNMYKNVNCMPMHIFIDNRTFNEIIATS